MKRSKCQPKEQLEGALTIDCDICDESLSGQDALKKHIRVVHNQTMINCNGCGSTFKWKRYLIQHQKQKKDCPAYDPNMESTATKYVPKKKVPPKIEEEEVIGEFKQEAVDLEESV